MNIENEYEQIRKNPYQYILDWMEMNLIVVGRQGFKTIALMPMSLFLPKIQFGSEDIRSHINNLYISDPATGKSTISKLFSQLCYNPLVRRSITEADLIKEAFELKWLSIVVEDLSQTANENYGIIKALEGIIGDEGTVNKSTMRDSYLGDVKGIGLLMVTPMDLEKFSSELESGLLSRCAITFIKIKDDEYKKIAEFINLRASDSKYASEVKMKKEIVVEFYKELRMIQQDKHSEYLKEKFGENHNKPILNPVASYDIELKFKQELLNKWNAISDNLLKSGHKPNSRDLHEYYRFLINLAYLNIHNRKNENGVLVPNADDHKIALELAIENMRYKWAIPSALKINRKSNSLDSIENYLNAGVPQVIRDVLMATSKYGRLIKENNQTSLKSNFTIK